MKNIPYNNILIALKFLFITFIILILLSENSILSPLPVSLPFPLPDVVSDYENVFSTYDKSTK